MNLMKRVTLTLLLSGFGLPAIAANGEMDTGTMTNGNYVVGPTFNYPFNTNSYSGNNRIADSNASVWPTTAANTVDNDGLIESQQSQLLGEWALRQIRKRHALLTRGFSKPLNKSFGKLMRWHVPMLRWHWC